VEIFCGCALLDFVIQGFRVLIQEDSVNFRCLEMIIELG